MKKGFRLWYSDVKIGYKWIFKLYVYARQGAELWPYSSLRTRPSHREGSGSETSHIPVLFMCIVCSSGHYLCPIISMEHKGVWCPPEGGAWSVCYCVLLCSCASRNTNDTSLIPMPNSLRMRLQCHLMIFSCYTMCSLESWGWLVNILVQLCKQLMNYCIILIPDPPWNGVWQGGYRMELI